MAALDFPSSPTVNQIFNAPNGAVYQWDGVVWKIIGSGAAGGDLSGSYPSPTVSKLNGAPLGVITPLARGDILVADSTPLLRRLGIGAASTVLQSNGTDVFWGNSLGGPPSGLAGGDLAGSYPNPTINPTKLPWTPSQATGGTLTPTDTTKTVTIPGTTANGAVALLGPTTGATRARLAYLGAGNEAALTVNRDWLNANAQDDATKPSWGIRFATDVNDNFVIQRSPAGAVTQTSILECRGSDGKTYCTLADASVTNVMSAPGMSVRQHVFVTPPTSGTIPSNSVWQLVCTTPAMTIRGNTRLLFIANVGLTILFSAGASFYIGIGVDGATANIFQMNYTATAGPVPPICFVTGQNQVAAGSHTFGYWIWGSGNGNFVCSSASGQFLAYELA